MTTIVVPEDRPFSALAAGLTGKEVSQSGNTPKFVFLKDGQIQALWREPARFADDRDHSLVIAGVRPATAAEVAALPSLNGDVVITYIPARETSSVRILEGLRQHGIFVTPPRALADCYLGDPAEVDNKWRKLAHVLSLELDVPVPSSQDRRLLDGFLHAYFRNPSEAAAMVQRNEIDEIESMAAPTDLIVKTENFGDAVCVRGANKSQSTSAFDGVVAFYRTKKQPIFLGGRTPAVFTTMPSLVRELLIGKNMPYRAYGFGTGGLIQFPDRVPEEEVILFMGQLTRQRVPILVISYGNLNEKTLRRKIVGGITKERKGHKTYTKKYRSMKDSDPGIEMQGKLIQVGQSSFEPVVRLLSSSGAQFTILS